MKKTVKIISTLLLVVMLVTSIAGTVFADSTTDVLDKLKGDGKVETSKGIELSQAEAERLWKRIKSFHDGAQFQHDLARDSSGHGWAFNSYKNDLLTAGCHRISFRELESIAKLLGFI